MIQITDVRKKYTVGKNELEVIKGISLEIKEGDFVSFMGPSGSGKSTLMNLLATIDDVTSGNIVIGDINIEKLDSAGKAEFRKDKLSFIFQNYNLISSLTIRENIVLPLLIKAENDYKAVDDIAFELGISDIMEKYPYEISGGQQQRCACARALISNKPILLGDEPTGALDSVNRKKFMNLLEKMNKVFGVTIILVTHDIFTACFSNKVYFMKDGKIERTLEKKQNSNETFFRELLQQVERMEDF